MPQRHRPPAPRNEKAESSFRNGEAAFSFAILFAMTDVDWNALVKEALDRTEFMAISTIGEDGSWTCPVQFGYDETLNLYFRSMPSSKHMRHLLSDDRMSVAIFKTERFPETKAVLGLQMRGRAKLLTERHEVEEAARHFYSRSPGTIEYRTKVDEHLGEDAAWKFVKIVPEEAGCFDSRIIAQRREIDLAHLSIKLAY